MAKFAFLVTAGIFSGTAPAAGKPFTGVFEGTGRACSGALHVRSKTIEWTSAFSVCKPTRYDVLERHMEHGRERLVFRLRQPSSHCLYSVVEVAHASGYQWSVNGYQSQESFDKKDLPDWSNSSLPERQILSCWMTGPN